MALALALGGRDASPYEPFPGGALGQLLADGVEAALGAAQLYQAAISSLLWIYVLAWP